MVIPTTLTGTSGTKATGDNRSLAIYADLKAGSLLLPDRGVYLEWSKHPTSGWSRATVAVTQPSAGRYQATVERQSTLYYRFRFDGDDTYGPGIGPVVKVIPAVRMTRRTSWTRLSRKKAYYAKGLIEPYHETWTTIRSRSGPTRRGSDHKYHYVKSFTARYIHYSNSKTAYKAKIVLSSRGAWMLKAHRAGDAANCETYGSADYVTVR